MSIAVDATSNGSASTSTTCTVSHAVGAGSNRILILSLFCSTNDTITGVTYGGVAMTQINKVASSVYGDVLYLYYLVAPATGSANIVATSSTPKTMFIAACSYTGASQTGQPDSSAISATTSTNSKTITTTVVAANSWLVGIIRNDAGAPTAGANTVIRANFVGANHLLLDSGSDQAAGSRSMNCTFATANTEGLIASISPAGATVITNQFFQLF